MTPNNAMQPTAASELAVPSSLRSSAAADGKRWASRQYAVRLQPTAALRVSANCQPEFIVACTGRTDQRGIR